MYLIVAFDIIFSKLIPGSIYSPSILAHGPRFFVHCAIAAVTAMLTVGRKGNCNCLVNNLNFSQRGLWEIYYFLLPRPS
jgi:hypothetical protein